MTEPSGHLTLDALADVLAGERDDPHLRTCRPCADRLAELVAADASVSAALAALPVPAVPEGLPARLARAVQDERRRELATVRPLRRRTPTWLPAAAASVALVLAGGAGWALLDLPGRGGQDAASVAAGGADGGSDGGGGGGAEQESAPQAAPETGRLASPESGPETSRETAADLALPLTDWADEASRPAALSRLLETADATATSSAALPRGDALDRLRDPGALAACLAGLPAGDADVLAVDYARYAGVPAVAVVQADGPDLVRITVVGSGCSAADPALLAGTVLPRP